MSVHVIKVPDIGEGIAEVELVAWHVKPGDVLAEDQALADVMTDKATVEIPSPVGGRVLELGGEVGQMLAVGAELIRIERDGAVEPVAAPAASVAPPSPPPSRCASSSASTRRAGIDRSTRWSGAFSMRPTCSSAPTAPDASTPTSCCGRCPV